MDGKYDDQKFGIVQRAWLLPDTIAEIGTAGTIAEAYISLPYKSKIVKFGIRAGNEDVVNSTSTTFELRTVNGTKLATFVPGSSTIGTGEATGVAPETATSIAQNHGMVVCIGTNPGVSGSANFFVDYQADWEGPTV
jgi:hypothetical protein